MTAAPASAQPADGTGPAKIVGAGAPDRVEGSYIVTLKEGTSSARGAERLAKKHEGKVKYVYRKAMNGFSASMSEAAALQMAADPDVLRVEVDRVVTVPGNEAKAKPGKGKPDKPGKPEPTPTDPTPEPTPTDPTPEPTPTTPGPGMIQTNPPSWGLDRIDQANLPMDNAYSYNGTASNVHAYIIDTGIRTTHEDFGGRATWGINATSDGIDTDCNGHGTHVAGTVGGTAHGVAKEAQLVAVKVLECGGSGTTSGVIAGVEWVTTNAVKPAVANMSLGGGASQALDDAIAASSASGVTYAVAAGNENADACGKSPARLPAAITVGSTAMNDSRSSFSNYGTCVDIFAPGTFITSSWNTSDTATNTISGTSMATPHVAGNAALLASANPNWTPEQVRDAMVADATDGVVTDPGTGSPNKLLRATSAALANDFSMSLSSSSATVKEPSSVTSTIDTTLVKGDPQTITFSAQGLPAGVTATFSPASVTTGQSTTMTLTTSAETPLGIHPVKVIAAAPYLSHVAEYKLGVSSTQCQDGQHMVNPGFEQGTTGWTAPAGVIGEHAQGPAYSGTANAVLGGKGTTNSASLSQKVSLPAGCAQYSLDYWLQVKTAETSDGPWDTLKVQVLNAEGTSVLKTLKTYSNKDGYSAPGYYHRSLDLSAYAGQDITVRFLYAEDWIWQTAFVLDDITLNVV